MADVPARTELAVTTGPIRGSHKIYVEGRDGIRIAMRQVDLEPSSGEPPEVIVAVLADQSATESNERLLSL